jgi:hypothetical protein
MSARRAFLPLSRVPPSNPWNDDVATCRLSSPRPNACTLKEITASTGERWIKTSSNLEDGEFHQPRNRQNPNSIVPMLTAAREKDAYSWEDAKTTVNVPKAIFEKVVIVVNAMKAWYEPHSYYSLARARFDGGRH